MAPTSLNRFIHSSRARSEGASLVTFCRIYWLLPLGSVSGVPRRKLLTLALGESLCDTYATYRACLPRSELGIEGLLSFVLGNEKKQGGWTRMVHVLQRHGAHRSARANPIQPCALAARAR